MQIIETNLTFNGGFRSRSKTVRTVLHHSDTQGDVSAATIHGWHLNQGWAGIGYHFVIHPNGTIERGRPEYAIGSHSGPNGNPDSIGVCFAGNFMYAQPTQAAINAYLELHAYLENKYGHQLSVSGHREVMATACPGDMFPLDQIRVMVRSGSNTSSLPTVTIQVGSSNLTGVLIGESSYAPVKALCEALGRQVQWDGNTNTVIVLPLQGTVSYTKDPKIAVNGNYLPATLIGESSYAPVKLLAESLGKTVTWDGLSNTVIIK